MSIDVFVNPCLLRMEGIWNNNHLASVDTELNPCLIIEDVLILTAE